MISLRFQFQFLFRFEVFKFSLSGMDKANQLEARVAQAIRLGAKAPKKTCMSLNDLKNKRKQEQEEARQQKVRYFHFQVIRYELLNHIIRGFCCCCTFVLYFIDHQNLPSTMYHRILYANLMEKTTNTFISNIVQLIDIYKMTIIYLIEPDNKTPHIIDNR